MNFGNTDYAKDDAALGLEAAQWLLRLDDSDPDPEDVEAFADLKTRNRAFFDCSSARRITCACSSKRWRRSGECR